MVGLRPSRKRIFLREFGADIEKAEIYKDVTDIRSRHPYAFIG